MAWVAKVKGDSFATITQLDASSALTVAVGDTVCVYVQHERTAAGLQTASCSDNLGNIYTDLGDSQNDSHEERGTTFVAKITVAGSATPRATFSSSVQNAIIAADQFSGRDTSSPVDQHTLVNVGSIGTGTDAVTTGNKTTTTDGQDIWGCAGVTNNIFNNQFAAGTGYTLRNLIGDGTNNLSAATESKAQASAGAVAATFTQANTAIDFVGIVTLKAASAGATIGDQNMRANRRGSGLGRGRGSSMAPCLSLSAYYREREQQQREFLAKVRRAA